jgi:hypothetical protein
MSIAYINTIQCEQSILKDEGRSWSHTETERHITYIALLPNERSKNSDQSEIFLMHMNKNAMSNE